MAADSNRRAQLRREAEHGRVIIREIERKLYRSLRDYGSERVPAILQYVIPHERFYLAGHNDWLQAAAAFDKQLIVRQPANPVSLVAVKIQDVL